MSDEVAKVQVIPPPEGAPSDAKAAGGAEVQNSEDAKFAAKYPGMKKPNVTAVARKRISTGGCQYFDSGDYNKDKKDGKAGAAAPQAPLAVTPGGTVTPGPSHLSALPKRMQRKPSGASRLGLPSQSPPKD